MKKTVFLCTLLLTQLLLKAQDTLLMTCDQVITGKIIDMNNPKKIGYKRLDQLDGRIYYQKRKEVQLVKFNGGTMQEITTHYRLNTPPPALSGKPLVNPHFSKRPYGYSYNNIPIGQNDMFHVMLQQHDAQLQPIIVKAKIARGLENIGYAAIPITLIDLLLFQIQNDRYGRDDPGPGPTRQVLNQQYTALGVAGALVGASITSAICYHQLKRKAVKIYNEKY